MQWQPESHPLHALLPPLQQAPSKGTATQRPAVLFLMRQLSKNWEEKQHSFFQFLPIRNITLTKQNCQYLSWLATNAGMMEQ